MDSVIVHYQEIALKGKNRPWFVERLVANLRAALGDLEGARVRAIMGRIEVTPGPHAAWDTVRERLGRVFGVANFAGRGASAAISTSWQAPSSPTWTAASRAASG